jgi:DNA recombination protein RmuC
MEMLYLFAGLILGFAIAWLWMRGKGGNPAAAESLRQQVGALEVERGSLLARVEHLDGDRADLRMRLDALSADLTAKNEQLARTEQSLRDQQLRLEEQKAEVEKLQQKFTTEFENIANRLLDEKSKKFTEQNKVQIGDLLNPLREQIKEFRDKVDATHKDTIERHAGLQQELKFLKDLNNQMTEEARNLTRALKGDVKKQGNWGEVVLERVLERSGLERDREYAMQVNFTLADGSRYQPDAVVYLPEDKHVIVDSKVSLVAYEQCVRAETEEERTRYLKEHVRSVRTHIVQLSEKQYQKLDTLNTPDFVLLFVPIEASFSVAVQADNELFAYAWDRQIVIVSPSTLLATLRTIASIWKQERQTRNALEIARQSGALYDKFVGFMEDLQKIRRGIDLSTQAYDSAVNKLSTGKGNLVRRAEQIRNLGAAATKAIPAEYLNEEVGEDDGIEAIS